MSGLRLDANFATRPVADVLLATLSEQVPEADFERGSPEIARSGDNSGWIK